MLPLSSKVGFLIFAVVMLIFSGRGFYRMYLRIRRGRADSEKRLDHWPGRLWYALVTTLSQRRTFRKRGVVSFFHSFIFYGFSFYLLVNLVDAIDGYVNWHASHFVSFAFSVYALLLYGFVADILSFLVLLGVVALVVRRFALPAKKDFFFNQRTLLHKDVQHGYITRDSLIVSVFILFHVASRAIGAGARIAGTPADVYPPFEPFATLLSHLFTAQNAHAWQVFGYWGALGSVLAFLAYFPYSKHIHIFAAPLKYFFARASNSGVLPLAEINLEALEAEDQNIGAEKLEDLAWPRLLDAYACIQCNRCQDVCPATATGKSLSPAALEINKRMELNDLGLASVATFQQGSPSPRPLLSFALTAEAAWACTTCGACMEVCPVQDEQMLDIIDIRRHQVMIKGEFPTQLQTAFRGMERAKNPWGISHDKRMDWADGLHVKTTNENPSPDVLYWVGCAASYDPQAQKTARAVVQLLDHAGVDYAVLGKRECCTGDSARRGGNELLYRQLADQNVSTLNEIRPKLVIASCPHCMNSLGNEYKQIGGDYSVMHHTQFLESLVANGKLPTQASNESITYHDPCYLGRHNGVYDAPRNLLRVLGNEVVELERNRSNSFCCGAGGAQFWKEEEPGNERVSENRYKEVQRVLGASTGEKILAVGCPFCKSMLGSTPGKEQGSAIAIKDVAEILLEGVLRAKGISVVAPTQIAPSEFTAETPIQSVVATIPIAPIAEHEVQKHEPKQAPLVERKKWQPKGTSAALNPIADPSPHSAVAAPEEKTVVERKKWQPKAAKGEPQLSSTSPSAEVEAVDGPPASPDPPLPVERKKWKPNPKP